MIIIMSRTVYKKFTSNLIWSLDCISCATARFTFTLTTVVSGSSLVMVTVAFSVESTLTVLDGSLSLSSADAGRERGRRGEGGFWVTLIISIMAKCFHYLVNPRINIFPFCICLIPFRNIIASTG